MKIGKKDEGREGRRTDKRTLTLTNGIGGRNRMKDKKKERRNKHNGRARR